MFTMMIESIPLAVLGPTARHHLTRDDGSMTNISPTKSWRRLAAVFAVTALVLSACGSESTPNKVTVEQPESRESPEPEPTESEVPVETEPEDTDVVDEDPKSPATQTVQTEYGEVTVTDVGVMVGSESAPAQVRIFADPRCPFCAQLDEMLAESTSEWARGDQVAVEHIILTFLDDGSRVTFSARAGNLLAVVADQAPEHWETALEVVYEMQPESPSDDTSDEELLSALEEAGVPIDDAFRSAVVSMEFDRRNQDLNEWAATDVGVTGVPTVYVNDEAITDFETFEEFVELINDAVSRS